MNIKPYLEEVREYLRTLIRLQDHVDVASARQSIEDSIRFRGPNVYILFFAIMIASLGLNVNSIPVIIGAMLISPLMGPILGLGLSLGTNDWMLMRSSLRNFVVMVLISIFGATLYFLLTPLSMEHPTELLARTSPTIYDVLIALFGGFAGILESSRKKPGNAVAGVAIATALMPPLCTVGYGISIWNWHYAVGALYLFSINCVYIALATWIMVKCLHYPSVEQSDVKKAHRVRVAMVILTIIMIIPSVISGFSMVRETQFTTQVNRFVANHKNLGRSYIYDYKLDSEHKPAVLHIYLAGEVLGDSVKAHFMNEAGLVGLSEAQIVFHDEAVLDVNQFNEEAFIKDLMAQYEQQLKDKNQTISELRQTLQGIEEAQIPVAQIVEEIQVQYPSISSLQLARTPQNEDGTSIILLLYNTETGAALSERELKGLKQWLAIRLHASDILIAKE